MTPGRVIPLYPPHEDDRASVQRRAGGSRGVGPVMLRDYQNNLRAKRRSEATIKLRLCQLRGLMKVNPNLYTVTPVQLDRYLASHEAWKPDSARAFIASAKDFYRWAVLAKKVKVSPAEHLEPPKSQPDDARIIPDWVVEDALSRATLRESAMLLLGRQGGLRRSEIASLKLSDRKGESLTVTGKGNKRRFVAIYGDLLDCLIMLELRDPEATYYFPGRFGGHIVPEFVYDTLTKLTGYNPHALRHAAGTAFYNATKDLRLTQEFMGHSSSKTTERYTHIDRSALIAATQRSGLRSIGRFHAPPTAIAA